MAFVALGGALMGRQVAIASSTVVVKPSAMNGWAFLDDNGNGGSMGFVSGPDTPPLGSGSASLIVRNSSQGVLIGTTAFSGTHMSNIDTLAYSTYRVSGAAALAPALQFDIDYDLTDLDTSFKGRLVFEPYYTNTVLTGSWQTWDTLTGVGTGNWWATKPPGNTFCPIGNPCTWSEVLGHFPNAGISTTFQGLELKAGSGWTSFQGSADNLQVGVTGNTTTFDFEAEPCTSICYVNAATGDDSFDGAAPFSAKKTIQGGVDAVSTGGTVQVAAGIYEEQVEITKALTVDGAGIFTQVKSPTTLTKFFTTSANNYPIIFVHDTNGANIQDLTVNGAGRANGNFRFVGIGYSNASGTIDTVGIGGIRETPISGTQQGVAIFAFANAGTPRSLAVTDTTINDYQKNGMTLAGADLTVNVDGNHVAGAGPVNFIAQNGIQVSTGAHGSVTGNEVSGNDYTPSTFSAVGILVFGAADGLVVSGNDVHDNMEGIFVQSTNDAQVTDNEVHDTRDTGIFAFLSDDGTYDGNSLHDGDIGLYIADSNHTHAKGNDIFYNTHGIIIDGDVTGADIINNNIHDNTGSSSGVHVQEAGGFEPSNVEIHFNDILNNGGLGGYGVFNSTTNVVDAENNWWGACDGPSGVGPGSGDPVSTNVDYDPWSTGPCDPDNDLLSNDQETLIYGTDPNNPDTDGDHCPDGREVLPISLYQQGGGRNPLNHYDYFNPSGDAMNRIDDILLVVDQFHKDDTDGNPGLAPYTAGYDPETDRTVAGPEVWRTGPPNGQQRVDDILNIVHQFHLDCA